MNKILFVAFAVVFALTSCSSSDDDGVGGPISTQIFGLIEKGPFVQGSEVTLTDLNKDLSQSGSHFLPTPQMIWVTLNLIRHWI